MKMISLQCMHCQEEFERRLTEHNRNINKEKKIIACSHKCTWELRKKYLDRSRRCACCETSFLFSKADQIYCSKSCSAKINNTKRKTVRFCKHCLEMEVQGKGLFCADCKHIRRFIQRENESYRLMTLKEMRETYGTSAFHSKIRGHARSIYRKNKGSDQCAVCPFNLHVEVAHIRSVKDFPETATVNQVNSFENLIGLCPNHHWMYDNGYMYDKTVGLYPQTNKLKPNKGLAALG